MAPPVPSTDPKQLAPWAEPAWVSTLHSPYYNDSHRRFRDYIRAYLDEHIVPNWFEWSEAGVAPHSARLAWAKTGIPFADVPPQYRPKDIPDPAGVKISDMDAFHVLVATDETSRVNGGVMTSLTGGSVIGVPPIVAHGTEEQKRRWLPGLFSWETSFCLGITEPGAGSDVGAIETVAAKSADGKTYVVNGYKKWITGAPWATHMTTAVRTGGPGPRGLSVLVIPLKSKGVSMRKVHNSGQNAGGASYIELDDVVVPAENLIGQEGQGFRIIMFNFNKERYVMAVGCNRMARTCLSEAFAYANKRHTFGEPLIAHQVIKHKFTNIARYLESHWAWLEQLAYHINSSPEGWQAADVASQIALAKVHGGYLVEMANREAQHIFGGKGYERGSPVEVISRDLRMMTVGGGSTEIMNDLSFKQEVMWAKKRGWKL
ncbi:acyl-CoA dehydrogenase NM domain-like protein [Eremomyces bilateralis CBS 781.70]|uniref:Acyl-CoA dehydrogenase NM domain-like protein n=1 Tax=Eremomyces bilateralis CBS 781.70 TaxID=1392243 RepID=A0A6G1G7J6_9PEZI|nr:acyl-CoA dehydrogenase NM domain-like protein [Eremomyces bilateralis CBS 781.70]KAF1814065.1 acyl-CoA dehydrogenase NM domain-like protein [Eremomyces bilateralis CBS 781.70]